MAAVPEGSVDHLARLAGGDELVICRETDSLQREEFLLEEGTRLLVRAGSFELLHQKAVDAVHIVGDHEELCVFISHPNRLVEGSPLAFVI